MPAFSSFLGGRQLNARSNNRRIDVSSLIRYSYKAPPAAVTNGISVAHVGAAAAGTRDMTLGGSLAAGGVATIGYLNLQNQSTALASPPVPRNVVITVTHATAVVAMSGTIFGTGMDGKPLQEDWSVTAGTASKTFTGKKAFSTVTRITETIAADASANTIIAGTGNVLGVGVQVAVPSAVKEMAIGVVVTTGTLVAASAVATDDPLGTYTPAAAPNGANNYDIWFISDAPGES